MKLFRVGYCLAFLMAGAACTQSPQTPTTPSAILDSSTANAADGSSLKVTTPAIIAPANGERAEDRNPTLVWLNSNGRYQNIGVAYDLELSTPAAVVYSRTVGESPESGAHRVELTLDYDLVYSWRVRARIGNDLGPWSNWASFMSPTRPVASTPSVSGGGSSGSGCSAPISPLGPGETRKPKPNGFPTVIAIATQFPNLLRRSCQEHGEGWEFQDRVTDALRLTDGRWGYNAKRGNMNDPSMDVVSYFYANGDNINNRHEVYIFDFIGGHCGSNPSAIWNDVTQATADGGSIGRTMYPRPGRQVGSCSATATAGQ